MKITQQSHFGNTPMAGRVTYREVFVYLGTFIIGALLFFSTSLFKYNWVAIIGYIAFVSVLLGTTPTGRSMVGAIYGIVFKRPIRMVVSSMATTNTLGHGIRSIDHDGDINSYAIKLYNGNYALVYVVTSTINNWSTPEDYHQQALSVKGLFNIMENGECLDIVTKHDSDTGMVALKKALDETENFEGDDLKRMSERRKDMLMRAGTSDVGRSVQQYVILKVKPKNVKRCIKVLNDTARIIRPAEYPLDILLAMMGLEGAPLEDRNTTNQPQNQTQNQPQNQNEGGEKRV